MVFLPCLPVFIVAARSPLRAHNQPNSLPADSSADHPMQPHPLAQTYLDLGPVGSDSESANAMNLAIARKRQDGNGGA